MTEVLSTSAYRVHPIVHLVVICDSTVKMVIHTASMRLAIMLDAERSRRRCLNFNVLPKAFEKPSPRLKVFQQRSSERRPNYMESTWGRILTNPRFKDPSDRRGGKLFRRRYRVPYPMFEKLVEITRENHWFSERPDCTVRPSAPLELKILLYTVEAISSPKYPEHSKNFEL